jgi:hypothetical protein
MPQLGLLIPLIISGVTAGKSLFGGHHDDSKSLADAQKAQAAADAQKQAEQEAATKSQLLRKAAPDAQAQTGGSLTDAPFASLTSSIAGLPGSVEDALRLLGGGGTSGTQGLSFSGGV